MLRIRKRDLKKTEHPKFFNLTIDEKTSLQDLKNYFSEVTFWLLQNTDDFNQGQINNPRKNLLIN